MAAVDFYHYTSLPQGQHIRVLTLNGGGPTDGLFATLQSIDISQKVVTVPYVAISYVWGSGVRCAEIVIDGLRLRITSSAEQVLRRMRVVDKPIAVWIDGICINQDDVVERESQVSFMHQVYSRASETFVWLGVATDDSDMAMQYAATLDWHKYDEEHHQSLGKDYMFQQKTFILDLVQDHVNGQRLLQACADLLSRRWFSRVWIQQEVSVSVKATAGCGQQQVSLNQVGALAWLFKEPWSIQWPSWIEIHKFETHRDIILTLQSMRRAHRRHVYDHVKHGFSDRSSYLSEIEQLTLTLVAQELQDPSFEPTKASFLSIMEQTSRGASATDPRDKIYAMLNMCDDRPYVPRPNYRIDWQELYTTLARDVLTYSGARVFDSNECEFLLSAGLANLGYTFELPSWVPDWRSQRGIWLLRQAGWTAGGLDRPRYKPVPIPRKQRTVLSRHLKLDKGRSYLAHPARAWSLQTMVRLMDEITSLSESGLDFDAHSSASDLADKLITVDKSAMCQIAETREDYYVTGQSMEDAYAHVLISGCGERGKSVLDVSMLSDLQTWREWLVNRCSGPQPNYMGYIRRSWVFREHKICMTKHKLMCLVPGISTTGDVVAVIRSVPFPVVLRPILDGHYLLLGECYVHGLMENQASLLIDEYKIKVKPDKTRSWRPEGDIRRNGLSTPAEVCHGVWIEENDHLKDISIAKYKALVEILGDQWITIV